MGYQSIYKTNGSGRDTYIDSNNGGFSVLNEPVKMTKPGTFLPVLKRIRENKSTIDSKTICYRTDGTGRDSYIGRNNGGFSNPSKMMEYRE